MPTATGKITLRSGTLNKTHSYILYHIMDFLVNSGNYITLANQINASNYFVVQSTRETGFVGDKIIAQIGIVNLTFYGVTWPYIYVLPYESWSGTTGTNPGVVRTGVAATNFSGQYPHDHTWFTLDNSQDHDIYISCDDTFILFLNRTYFSYSSWCPLSSNSPTGVVAFERLPGDNDTGTFYGHYGHEQRYGSSPFFYVPKRFDNATGSTASFRTGNMLGSTTNNSAPVGLYGKDESDNYVGFNQYVHLATSGKMKGRLYGVKTMPVGKLLGHSDILTDNSGGRYMIGKLGDPTYYCSAMEIAPVIEDISLTNNVFKDLSSAGLERFGNAAYSNIPPSVGLADPYSIGWYTGNWLVKRSGFAEPGSTYLIIDLKSPQYMQGVRVLPDASPYSNCTYEIEGSLDKTNWTSFGTATSYGAKYGVATYGVIEIPNTTAIRYLRFTPKDWGSSWVAVNSIQVINS